MISIKKVTEKIVTFFLEFLKDGLSEKPLQALITIQPCPSFHIVKSYVHFVGQWPRHLLCFQSGFSLLSSGNMLYKFCFSFRRKNRTPWQNIISQINIVSNRKGKEFQAKIRLHPFLSNVSGYFTAAYWKVVNNVLTSSENIFLLNYVFHIALFVC